MSILVLLLAALLTMWVNDARVWSLLQVSFFSAAAFRYARRPAAPTVVLAIAAAWAVVQVILGLTLAPTATIVAALNWITLLTIFAASEGLPLEILSAASCAMAVLAVLTKYSAHGNYFWLWASGYTADVLGPFVNRNQYAAWVELVLPVSLYLAVRRPAFTIAAAVLYASAIASGSRAGAALVTIEALLFIGIWQRKLLWRFGLLAVAAVALAGWRDAGDRLHSLAPDALRVDALKASIQMVRDHPWIGIGLGSWSRIYPRYAGFDSGLVMNQAHNDWAQWAAEGGIPFLLLMILFAALLWKPAIRSIYGVGLLVFLAHGLVDYPMQERPALAAWFFALAGSVTHDALRRARSRSGRDGGRDSSRIPAAGPANPSGSILRPGEPHIGRVADEAAERCAGAVNRS